MSRRKPEPLDRAALLDYALKALGLRAMSSADLRSRLLRRAAHPSDIDGVIEKLEESGLLDDRRFAGSYAAARLENQGFGRLRVLSDLRQRRVPSSVADQAVQQVFQDTDEVQLVEQYVKRKYRGKDLAAHFSEQKNVLSAFRRLRAAGFGPGPAIQVLKRYAQGVDDLADAEIASEPLEE